MGDLDLILGLGRSLGEGKGYPLQYSGLENSMDEFMGSQRIRHDWVTFTSLLGYGSWKFGIWEGKLHLNVIDSRVHRKSSSLPLHHHFPTSPQALSHHLYCLLTRLLAATVTAPALNSGSNPFSSEISSLPPHGLWQWKHLSPNHWTTREFPRFFLFKVFVLEYSWLGLPWWLRQ